MDDVTRRKMLAAGAAAGMAGLASSAAAATFGNPDEPAEGAINAKNSTDLAVPGPHDTAVSDQFPSAFKPSPADAGDMPEFWATFNNAPRCIQDGGWARQVTSSSFPIATEISGVDMRLAAGAIREFHWHQAAEWAYVTYGADEWQYYIKGEARMGVFNTGPKAVTMEFHPGDIGYVKRNLGHYIKNAGTKDLAFLEVFRGDTYQEVLLSDWLTHTPTQMVTAHLNVPADTIARWPNGNAPVVPV